MVCKHMRDVVHIREAIRNIEFYGWFDTIGPVCLNTEYFPTEKYTDRNFDVC